MRGSGIWWTLLALSLLVAFSLSFQPEFMDLGSWHYAEPTGVKPDRMIR